MVDHQARPGRARREPPAAADRAPPVAVGARARDPDQQGDAVEHRERPREPHGRHAGGRSRARWASRSPSCSRSCRSAMSGSCAARRAQVRSARRDRAARCSTSSESTASCASPRSRSPPVRRARSRPSAAARARTCSCSQGKLIAGPVERDHRARRRRLRVVSDRRPARVRGRPAAGPRAAAVAVADWSVGSLRRPCRRRAAGPQRQPSRRRPPDRTACPGWRSARRARRRTAARGGRGGFRSSPCTRRSRG